MNTPYEEAAHIVEVGLTMNEVDHWDVDPALTVAVPDKTKAFMDEFQAINALYVTRIEELFSRVAAGGTIRASTRDGTTYIEIRSDG